MTFAKVLICMIGKQKSGPSGDRTHDLQIISLALYRLSYRTILVCCRQSLPLMCLSQHPPQNETSTLRDIRASRYQLSVENVVQKKCKIYFP